MRTIEEVQERSADIKPGAVIRITGYCNSSGETQDVEVELLDSSGYVSMLKEDLRLLRGADVAVVLPDTPMVDAVAAKESLITSKEASLAAREDAGSGRVYQGADYVMMGDNLAGLPGKDGCVYILRMRCLSGLPSAKPAKGTLPRTKQLLAAALDLPTTRYLHAVLLSPGKFKSLEIL